MIRRPHAELIHRELNEIFLLQAEGHGVVGCEEFADGRRGQRKEHFHPGVEYTGERCISPDEPRQKVHSVRDMAAFIPLQQHVLLVGLEAGPVSAVAPEIQIHGIPHAEAASS